MGQNAPITSKSIPDYDSWGIDSYWSKSQWKEYYEALVDEFGEKDARLKWAEAYDRPGRLDIFPARANYLMDKAFADWLQDNGLYDLVATGLLGAGNDVVLVGTNATRTLAKGADSLVDGVGITAKALKYVVPVAVAIVIIIVILSIKNKVEWISGTL